MYLVKCVIAAISILFLFTISLLAQSIDTIWTANYWNGYNDTANCVQQTSDSGFIITGCTAAEGETYFDIILIKTDREGNPEWQKIIGDSAVDETGYHVIQTYDGGYLVSASSYAIDPEPLEYRVWILKTDENGDTTWSYALTIGDNSGYPLYSTQTSDSGYAIVGGIYIYGLFMEAFILKLDKDGNYDWYHTYGGNNSIQDAWYITQLPDSGYIVAGNNDNPSTSYDFWVFRTDKDGITQWDSTYAITSSTEELRHACRVDDGIVLTGRSYAMGYVHKIDFDGNTLWSKSISQIQANEYDNSICPTSDGGFMVGGWVGVVGHYRDYCFIKVDSVGDTVWTFSTGGNDNDHGRYIVPTYDDGYVLVGTSFSFVNGISIYMVKIGNTALDVEDDILTLIPTNFCLENNSPNPFNPATTISYYVPYRSDISLTVYNILGEKVKIIDQGLKTRGFHTTEWDSKDAAGNQVAGGIYLYCLRAGNYSESKKMLLLK